MPKVFLQLPRDEQSKILRALGPAISRAPSVLEKDVWPRLGGMLNYHYREAA
ncbi:MAG: hypothetical protein ACYDDO_15310 [Acidiferrobacterales bacterium]